MKSDSLLASFSCGRVGHLQSPPEHIAVAASHDLHACSNSLLSGQAVGGAAGRFAHDFSKVRNHFPPLASPIQSKPTVNSPGDRYEREADDVADKVMRMAETAPHASALVIQRKCAACEDEEKKRKVQTKRVSAKTGDTTLDAETAARAAEHGGWPLPDGVRSFFETRFDQDFSRVRVHTDSNAADGARAVRARAYTIGHDIVFAPGEYAPASLEGKRLLAHELVHVVQQGASAPNAQAACSGHAPAIQRQESATPKKPDERAGGAAQAIEEARSRTLAELGEIESNWKEMRDAAASFAEAADWLNKGDIVIGLLRTHTEMALEAQSKGDSPLSNFMTSIVESDMVMYRFVAWHVAVFVNLIALEPQLTDLANAFAADNRPFTGRAAAEERVKLMLQLAATYRKQSPKWLELVKFIPAEVTGTSGRKVTLTVTIAAHHDTSVSALFASETEKFVQDQAALVTLVGATNEFLNTAFREGLVQAAEALVEYYQVRGSRRGGPKAQKSKAKKQQASKQEKKQEGKQEKKQEGKQEKKEDAKKDDKDKKKEEEKKRESCAGKYPGKRLCSSLPLDYVFPSHVAALEVVKRQTGRNDARITTRQKTTGGPCIGEGNHWGVKAGGDYLASLVSCPCCKEIAGRAILIELWAIKWH
jgi:hypothetical protein